MPNVGAVSPPAPDFNQQQQQQHLPRQIQTQIMEIENQVRARYPDMSQQQAHGQALHIAQQRLMNNQVVKNNVDQTAMTAAVGSPHQPILDRNAILGPEDDTTPVSLDSTGTAGVSRHPQSSLQRYNSVPMMGGSAGNALEFHTYSGLPVAFQKSSNLAGSSAPSDSGYGSLSHPRLESSIVRALTRSDHPGHSAATHLKAIDGASTTYSGAESIQQNGLVRYVTEFAEELSGMFPTSLPSTELSRLASTLPVLLKDFAVKLGFCDASPISRNLMYLVHRYRQ